jgi:ferredoxin/flavodoxin
MRWRARRVAGDVTPLALREGLNTTVGRAFVGFSQVGLGDRSKPDQGGDDLDHKVAICFFSGTGNTAYVVELAREAFARSGVAVDLFEIENLRRNNGTGFDSADYVMLGIAHPILGFDCPGFIYDFARALPPAEKKPVFLLKTAGDYHAANHSASYSIKRILMRKGYDPFYDEIIVMPGNWLKANDDQLNRQIVEVAPRRVEAAVQRILARERRTLSNALPMRLLLKAVSHLKCLGAKLFGRYLRANASCQRCGTCVRNCPAGNITLENDRIVFDNACVWCMRCIYNCPQHAIDNKYMNVFILKGGYSLARIRALKCEPIDFANPNIPSGHRYFQRYFEEQPE